MKTTLIALIVLVVAGQVGFAQKVVGRSEPVSFGSPKPSGTRDGLPVITITQPASVVTRGLTSDDATAPKASGSTLTVKGIATSQYGIVTVTINGTEARLSLAPEGTAFEGEALMTLGKNEIEVHAMDKHKLQSTLKFTVMREAGDASVASAASQPKGQRWAVVVGVSKYKDTDIPPLRYADADAKSFAQIVTTPMEEGGLGVPKSNIRLLLNEQATSTNVREALTDFLKSAIEDDIVFIYFAGHGAPDPDRPRVLYLLTTDSKLDKIASTSIKMQEIQDALKEYVAAKSVLVFADACHSRGVSKQVATRALASPDLVNQMFSDLAHSRESSLSFSASDANQLSQEDKRWGGGHGVFTYYLTEGLKGAADFDGDKIIRLGELTQYVSDHVRRDTKSQQSPISSGSYDTNLPLTLRP